ncbi:MAG TPA: thioredoxin family protein [Candidatus Polarisedimenticolia bacterium]|nr:thioredoxin family protein [Candidatus Polarisedimenticolia bacterium]
MRKTGLIVAVLVLAATFAGAAHAAGEAAAAGPIALGTTIPMSDTKMKGVDGKEMSIADVKGAKGTLVVFTCNACPWAKAWEDRIVALGNDYSKKGIGVIAVNANDPAKVAEDGYAEMQTRAKEKNFGFPYVVDATSGVAKAFGATRTPEAFLFDAKGALVYHGTIDDNAQEPAKVKETYLKDALNAVSSGQGVAVKETKAMGCGIKFRA